MIPAAICMKQLNMEVDETPDDASQPETEEMEIDWKKRTAELEEELLLLRERVNSQTSKIRDVVSKRVCILFHPDQIRSNSLEGKVTINNDHFLLAEFAISMSILS